MELIKISIANDFSKTPGSRNRDEGDYSGQEFREDVLEPAFQRCIDEDKKLEVNLDGVLGYGTSFLEEVFGGLARKFTPEKVSDRLIIISEEEKYLTDDINQYIRDAKK